MSIFPESLSMVPDAEVTSIAFAENNLWSILARGLEQDIDQLDPSVFRKQRVLDIACGLMSSKNYKPVFTFMLHNLGARVIGVDVKDQDVPFAYHVNDIQHLLASDTSLYQDFGNGFMLINLVRLLNYPAQAAGFKNMQPDEIIRYKTKLMNNAQIMLSNGGLLVAEQQMWQKLNGKMILKYQQDGASLPI